jgi:hypothetical protein
MGHFFFSDEKILKIVHMEGQRKKSQHSYNIVVKMTILMCDYSQMSQKPCWQPPKLLTLLHIFMWCHLNAMLIIGIYACGKNGIKNSIQLI